MKIHHKFIRQLLSKTKNNFYKGCLSHQKQIIDYLLGYNQKELFEHLNKFDYDKNDYHVDHIVPINLFQLNKKSTLEEILMVNKLVNLMPLSSKDNLKKKDKITLEFVPLFHLKELKLYIEELFNRKLISEKVYLKYMEEIKAR